MARYTLCWLRHSGRIAAREELHVSSSLAGLIGWYDSWYSRQPQGLPLVQSDLWVEVTGEAGSPPYRLSLPDAMLSTRQQIERSMATLREVLHAKSEVARSGPGRYHSGPLFSECE